MKLPTFCETNFCCSLTVLRDLLYKDLIDPYVSIRLSGYARNSDQVNIFSGNCVKFVHLVVPDVVTCSPVQRGIHSVILMATISIQALFGVLNFSLLFLDVVSLS